MFIDLLFFFFLVNGGYTAWALGLCSQPCGLTGVLTRTRTCTNPAPSNGGLTCIQQNLGPASESNVPCNRFSCPGKKPLRCCYDYFGNR